MNIFDTDPVEHALTRLYQMTTATTVAPEVGVIVDRARRRRRNHAVLAGIAVLATIAVGVALTAPLRDNTPLPPISPTPTPTDGRADPTLIIPSGFLEGSLLSDLSDDVVQDPDDPVEWRTGFSACQGTPIDQLLVRRGVGEAPVSVSLYLYADETAARTAFAGMAADLHACIGYPHAQPAAEPWQSFGDESVAVTFPQPADGSGELTGMAHRAIAVRVGRAIEVVESGPSHSLTGFVEAASRTVLESVVAESMPRLCVYSGVGCAIAPGMPSTLPKLTANGEAWLVVLDVVNTDEADMNVGRAVAFAAGHGYSPQLVPWGCDAGVESALVGDDPSARYVALYFATPEEAEEMVEALPAHLAAHLNPTIHHVRTGCLRT